MDKNIKQSIDVRKQAFAANYQVDANMQKKIDTLFKEIEELGKSCQDVNEFEANFASSPLNQKYLDLFTEIATKAQANPTNNTAKSETKASVNKTIAEETVKGVAENLADQAINAAAPTRASVHQAAYDAVRDVPVLGNAIDLGQKASYAAHLGKLFKSRKKK